MYYINTRLITKLKSYLFFLMKNTIFPEFYSDKYLIKKDSIVFYEDLPCIAITPGYNSLVE